jgi:hypothetical protein
MVLEITIQFAKKRPAVLEEESGHIFVVSTFKITFPDGGSQAELDSLLQVINEVQKGNEKELSQITLRHLWGSDSRDLVVITEYASLADFDAAQTINIELSRKKWPERKDRRAFFRKLNSYFEYHSDEIMQEQPEYRK